MLLLRSLLFNVTFFLWTFFFVIICSPIFILKREIIAYFVRIWSKGASWLLKTCVGLSYKVEGSENIPFSPCLFACKHQSAWETICLFSFLEVPAMVLKKNLTKIPFVGGFITRSGMIPIDRKGGRSSLVDLLKKSEQAIKRGQSVFIFPEGTRSPVGNKGTYFQGVGFLYKNLNVPVVPIALNSGLFWGRRSFIKKPGLITIKFLPSILPGQDRDAFMELLEDSIEKASQKLY